LALFANRSTPARGHSAHILELLAAQRRLACLFQPTRCPRGLPRVRAASRKRRWDDHWNRLAFAGDNVGLSVCRSVNSATFAFTPSVSAADSAMPCSAVYFRMSSVMLTRSIPLTSASRLAIYLARFLSAPFIEQKCGPHIEHQPSSRLPSSLKSYDVARRRDRELREEKSWGSPVNLTTMTDSLHPHNSKFRGGCAQVAPAVSWRRCLRRNRVKRFAHALARA